jgi:hypothetical protein
MSIWNKVLAGLIFVALVGFCYLAMRTLKTQKYWRELAARAEQKIEALKEENRQLIEGTGEGEEYQPGITQLRLDLHKLLVDRGRVWYKCEPKVDPQTGRVTLTVKLPDPHGITKQTILYAFEAADIDQGNLAHSGQYLGEFRVTDVAGQEVKLEPSMKIAPGSREFQRLVGSKGPWDLYDIMPVDSHDAFAGLSEADLKKLLPEASVNEFVKDGQKARPDDLDRWGVKGTVVDQKGQEVEGNVEGTYLRPLRDYGVLFNAYHLQESVLIDLIESAERDKHYMEDAAADAKRQEQFQKDERKQLKAELTKRTGERDVVVAHRKALEAAVAALQTAIAKVISENRTTASQIAEIQMDATRRIDAQLRRMVQSGAAGSQLTE